jgi:hypothetical protein
MARAEISLDKIENIHPQQFILQRLSEINLKKRQKTAKSAGNNVKALKEINGAEKKACPKE